MLNDYIKNLFADQALIDDREPIWTFTVPDIGIVGIKGGEFGLFAPSVTPWSLTVYLIIMHTIINCITAVAIYKFIIPNRGTTAAYLIGWGIIVPIGLYLPFWCLEFVESQNKFVNLSGSMVMTCIVFKTIEAMYDGVTSKYVSPVIEESISNYVGYVSTMAPYKWDDGTEKKGSARTRKIITRQELFRAIGVHQVSFIVTSIFLSFLMAYDFQPFATTFYQDNNDNATTTTTTSHPNNKIISLNGFTISTDLFLSIPHLLDAYLHAWFLYFVLTLVFEGGCLSENLKGFATYPIFNSPLTQSKSPTDFWTNRWNMMIHKIFKSGVFYPAKQIFGGSTKIALFVTFVISGLYHDYAWQVMFYNVSAKYDNDNNNDGGGGGGGVETRSCISTHDNCYEAMFGRVTAFFTYVGIIMLLERPISKLPIIQWMSTHLPPFVNTQLLLLIHLPLVHWYGGDWMIGGTFQHMSIGLWHIRRI